MASGNYARKPSPQMPIETTTLIPPRATRQLPGISRYEEEEPETSTSYLRSKVTKALQLGMPEEEEDEEIIEVVRPRRIVNAVEPSPLKRHRPWMVVLSICIIGTVVFIGVLLSAAMMQRTYEGPMLHYPGGGVYSIQVGGSEQAATNWQKDKPQPQKTPIPVSTGPYSVLGKPTITADFINRVLASYRSPAAGKGQALYDLGVKYGIDPVYALAFFMHESTFGTAGQARTTLSLGNLRCIPDRPCVDQDRGGYAQMYSWEDGFGKWYALIRNLYVAEWGRATVDAIIPKYAPNADSNNEAAYIKSVKHAVDAWRAGQIRV